MTDVFILDSDDFYLKGISKKLKSHGLNVVTCTDRSMAIEQIREKKPKVVILQRIDSNLRKSLIVQMSEQLLMGSCHIFLSNDLKLEEMDEMIAQSLGFEKIVNRPLNEDELKEIFPNLFKESVSENGQEHNEDYHEDHHKTKKAA